MRIAQVAPLYESVPPKLYGGTERVVSYLTEELVRLGNCSSKESHRKSVSMTSGGFPDRVSDTRAVLADPILAAVDDNCLPGDESSVVACQKKNRSCHILGFSQPLDSLLFPGATFLLF
jgi:hypothetical protein